MNSKNLIEKKKWKSKVYWIIYILFLVLFIKTKKDDLAEENDVDAPVDPVDEVDPVEEVESDKLSDTELEELQEDIKGESFVYES